MPSEEHLNNASLAAVPGAIESAAKLSPEIDQARPANHLLSASQDAATPPDATEAAGGTTESEGDPLQVPYPIRKSCPETIVVVLGASAV